MRKLRIGAVALLMAGMSAQSVSAQRNLRAAQEQTVKYSHFIQMVDAMYVDSVSLEKLTETAIIKALAELDPHSVYIPKAQLGAANAPMEGQSVGVGMLLNLKNNELLVADVFEQGPAQKAGLQMGDKVLSIDGKKVEGTKIDPKTVDGWLKGNAGGVVKLKVEREKKKMEVSLTRGQVPIYSVDAAYMVDKNIGYIKIAQFSMTTIGEFTDALKKLQVQGMKDLVIDLQANGGGFLGAASGVLDHLLDGGKTLAYTDPIRGERLTEKSTPEGLFQNGRVVVLINEQSASSSEIVAGAVQDWDRGLVVGRRSFGKGLAQQALALPDGSMIRLTVAHYYTPSGRCLQKPYKQGGDYFGDVAKRYRRGELFNADRMEVNDTAEYYTLKNKRLVHGGGGIIPDVFVPVDTSLNYSYLNQLFSQKVFNEYVFDYFVKNKKALKQKYAKFEQFERDFQVTDEMIEEIVTYGEKAGVKRDDRWLKASVPTITYFVKGMIARNLWGKNEYFRVFNGGNAVLKAAVQALKDGTYERILN